ncbi:MAG: DUF4397 domain-containing protein [Gemmatimonadaceae bacterium]|nr:DUF4397 domain-containing protein [Gemmatimonadaceae bacterium]
MTLIPSGVLRVVHRPSLAILAAAALFAGCGTKDAADPLISGPQGRVRLVSLITDTTRGRVNATLEGKPFGVNLTYGGTTPSSLPSPANAIYSAILTGARTLVLKRTADTTAVVATIPLNIATGADYTVYATGGASASAIVPVITTDTNTAPALGAARVRIVHQANGAGAVDVFVTAVGADLALATPSLANVALRGAAYLASPAGTYQVRAVPAGTAPALRAANVTVNLASIAIPANGARTIVAAESTTGGAPYRFITYIDR